MARIRVENINKSYGENHVLKDLSFEVEDGKFLSLLGASGCGKTTVLRIISGLEYPDSGNIFIDDKNITAVPAERRNMGMVFQNYALFPHMTVFNNIAYGLKIRKVRRAEIKRRVFEVIELVGLQGMERRRVTKLSGGQQQRVALARALVIEPHILLLDEPLSALDRKIRAEMQYEIMRIQRQIGITTLFVTHDQEEAMTMSDHILLMNKGEIEQLSPPEDMYNHPVSLYASDFLGKANTLPGRLLQRDGNWYAQGRGWRFAVLPRDGFADGQDIFVAIRGEQFTFSEEPHEDSCAVILENRIFTGAVCKLVGLMGEDRIEIACINTKAIHLKKGQKIYVSIAPLMVHYFKR